MINNSGKLKKRVVIVGNSPLPIENTSRTYAPGIRTWHFAYSARDSDYKVLVIGCRIPKSYSDSIESLKDFVIDDIECCSVEPVYFENKDWLRKKILDFRPDCVVGVNTHPCSIVSELDLPMPFWADLNGSAMAEAQTKSFVYDDNLFVKHFFDLEVKVFQKADVFSVVSESQGFMLIGELSVFGRLSKETMGYRLVRVIPNASLEGEYLHTKNVIREKLVPKNSFVILYSGGYNTWTDVETMFCGLEKAMMQNQSIHFVSTGGQIEGHDEITYKHFQELIKNSKFKERFHLCGWVPTNDVPNYYLEADLGINSDRYCYEAILGARTRTQDWLRAGLPFISTTLSEVTEYLVQNELAYGFEQGNSDSLCEKILQISKNRPELNEKSEKLKQVLADEFVATKTFSDFIQWLEKPTFSPDHGKPLKLLSDFDKTTHSLKQTLGIAIWPKVSSVLRRAGLGKYEEKVKLWGFKLLFEKKSKKYSVKFLEVNIPTLFSGQQHLIPVTIKNTGNIAWETPTETNTPINLSYVWYDLNGNEFLNNEERTPLPKSVKPGRQITLDSIVTAPNVEGKYALKFDLVKENKFWFSEHSSSAYSKNVIIKNLPSTHNRVSVIVVSYNSDKYIAECLDSLLKSTIPLEIIVVDNNSTDNTVNILHNYEKKIKLIKSTENLGFAGGNNLGIKNSHGDITVLINPDAYVKENTIEELIKPLLCDEKVMITGPKIFYPKSTKIQSAGGILNPNGLPYHLGYGIEDNSQYDFPRSVDYVTGAAMAIRRKHFEITGLFDTIYNPAYYEETEKCIQAKKLGYKIIYVPQSIVYHHESTTLTALSEKFLKLFHTNRFKFVYRNFSFKEYINFLFSEIKWFLTNCGSNEKKIVLRAHLNTIFNPQIKIKNKIRLDENH